MEQIAIVQWEMERFEKLEIRSMKKGLMGYRLFPLIVKRETAEFVPCDY